MAIKAKCGIDYIRDQNWQPMKKGLNGWAAWARKEAKKMSSRFTFNAVICQCDGYVRISFAGQPEKHKG